jgi:hypothetical protein
MQLRDEFAKRAEEHRRRQQGQQNMEEALKRNKLPIGQADTSVEPRLANVDMMRMELMAHHKKHKSNNAPLTAEEIARGDEVLRKLERQDVEKKLDAERNKEAFSRLKNLGGIPDTYHQAQPTEPNYTGMIANGMEGEDLDKARQLYNLSQFLKDNPQYQAPSYDDNSLLQSNENIYNPATRIHPIDMPGGVPLQENQPQIYQPMRDMPSQMNRGTYFSHGGITHAHHLDIEERPL